MHRGDGPVRLQAPAPCGRIATAGSSMIWTSSPGMLPTGRDPVPGIAEQQNGSVGRERLRGEADEPDRAVLDHIVVVDEGVGERDECFC